MKPTTEYLLFVGDSNIGRSPPVMGNRFNVEISRNISSAPMFSRLNKKLWLWRTACRLYRHHNWPLIYQIKDADTLVHYSFMMPWLGRIESMERDDYEIGPCWTAPDYRRQGLFRAALQHICVRFGVNGRSCWILCRSYNTRSINAIRSARFKSVGECTQKRRRFLIGHYYVPATLGGAVSSEAVTGEAGAVSEVTLTATRRQSAPRIDDARFRDEAATSAEMTSLLP